MSETYPGPIVITGSNGGLGSVLVSDFLAAGVTNLACQYRSSSERVSAVLAGYGLAPDDHLFRADLTVENDVRAMREAVESRLGTPWGVVNLAGSSTNGVSWKLALEDFAAVVQSNLISTFLTTREFLPAMRGRGGGRIINVSSIVAHMGVPGTAHYSAAKAGIEGFTRAVAQEVANKGIAVNALALGYFDAGVIAEVPSDLLEDVVARIPVGRLGRASEIYPLMAYLLTPEAAFLTGQVLHLNGGNYL